MTSKYAKRVRRLLRKNYPVPAQILSEVSVAKLTQGVRYSKRLKELIRMYDARPSRMRVDFWVKHQVAIEVHGEQHEQEVRFSNDIEDTEVELIRRKGLDLVKQEALNEAGIPLVIVWYYEIKDLTAEQLKKKIMAAQAQAEARKVDRISEAPKQSSRLRTSRRKLSGPRGASKMGNRGFGPRVEGDGQGSRRLAGSTLARKPLSRRNRSVPSKLSRDWKRHKEERED